MKFPTTEFSKYLCLSIALLCGLLALAGCETGESAFRQGDFAEAARVSADRLARKPDNEKAAEIFLRAYPQARAEWLGRARQAQEDGSDPFRWERVLSAYEVLQGLSSRAALTPFAGKRGIEIVYYHAEIESARSEAGKGRIQFADALMESGDLYDAREAHEHYLAATRFVGQRADVLRKADEARRAGTLLVGIDGVTAQGHSLNPERMMAALVEELERHPPHRFVAFVPSSELGEREAVQYLELSIGEVSVSRSEAEVGERSFRRVLTMPVQNSEAESVEVKAKVFKREKTFDLFCPARVLVFEGSGWDAVFNRELPGRSVWAAQWDVLQGDRRAIEGQELSLSEPADPEHAKLMQQLTESVAAQARDALASFYREG
ncbi:hypothetical protein [Pelagicoccus sp. SDUM812005]|uniref:hypothetical protein n=1 Tax=Pelagicoccus sp. SDUM812005 TaxID=3041257 RepID=UPI00280D99FE|nr:hypothetical protein [Pelagicoccus sp. SDUM812005]MDQ8182661.1 hypothetical protein [Pelagicoccus sp. SDUM812005]